MSKISQIKMCHLKLYKNTYYVCDPFDPKFNNNNNNEQIYCNIYASTQLVIFFTTLRAKYLYHNQKIKNLEF